MTRTECDNCRGLADAPAPDGWIILAVQEEEADGPYQGCRSADLAATLCGWKCVAEYATAKALIPAEGDGSAT
jgi:hypothetical protein